ncbi:hypothetical protein XI25_08225 [Paenibacillus sp. DMB20]|nr:hypothetical protein XI25_08225 [Paenibacillus sp. DMB20]
MHVLFDYEGSIWVNLGTFFFVFFHRIKWKHAYLFRYESNGLKLEFFVVLFVKSDTSIMNAFIFALSVLRV